MTKIVSVLQVSLDEYVTDRHNMFLRLLKNARQNKKITERFYNELILQTFEPETWDEAFNQLETYGEEICHAIANYEYYHLLDRLEKGEEMITNETNEVKRTEYQVLYDKLAKQLEGMEIV